MTARGDLREATRGATPQIDVTGILEKMSTGLWSVANECTRSDLATAMRGRAEEFDTARAAMAELVEAIRPHVAMTFDEARAAGDRGQNPIYCQSDVLNPCWTPEQGVQLTTPLQHWGGGDACPDCRLRAALAAVGGAK